MTRYLQRPDDLHIDLRLGFMAKAQERNRGLVPRVSRGGTVGPAVGRAMAGSQPVVAKSWIGKSSTTSSHLRYLTQGKGRDGEDAPLFDAQGVVQDRQRVLDVTSRDAYQYRWLISPLHGNRLHMMPYVQGVMKRVEHDLKRPLVWVAATHHDTAFVHTHILVAGRDQRGKPLIINPHYLHHGLWTRAREEATVRLGRIRPQDRATTSARVRMQRETFRIHGKGDGLKKGGRMEQDRQRDGDTHADVPAARNPQQDQGLEALVLRAQQVRDRMQQLVQQGKSQAQHHGLER